MNIADYLAIIIILGCMGAGIGMGFIRSLAMFVGVFLAFQVANSQIAFGQGRYVGVFLGVFIGATVVGFLVYGATRMQLIDAMEGVFGAILGLLTGWGLVKFLFSIYIIFKPTEAFVMTIQASMFGMDIYNVSPYVDLMNRTTTLRKPDAI